MDISFEEQLLASRLVSEIQKTPKHISITLTGEGVFSFAKAMRLAILESEIAASERDLDCTFPDNNKSLITKKEVMTGLNVSHTTLWKWENLGYLIPVKIGRRVFYRRKDIENLSK